MERAYDIMTRAVATTAPETPVSEVAKLMRDLNIGDVLIVQDGKLRGIVTDRDLAIQALTNGGSTGTPVQNFMTAKVVLGSPDWSVEHIAKVMGDHQIRRLPIVENDNVVGIVSLGDVALHAQKRQAVARSLKDISEGTRTRFNRAGPLSKLVSIAIPLTLVAGGLLFASSQSGKRLRRQWSDGQLTAQTRRAIGDAVNALQDPRTRQSAFEALTALGVSDKARHLLQDGIQTLQDSQARTNEPAKDWTHESAQVAKRASKLAGQARDFSDDVAHRLEKSNHKRFMFV